MRFEQLDLNLLVALDILLEEQNITRSAERLHLSQSATSGILSRLRGFFDDDLLVQIGKKMHPTPFALELQGPVAGVLATIRGSIIGKKANNPEKSERHFKIIATDYVIQVLLSKMVAKVAKLSPHVTFEFLTPFTHEMNLLSRGGADMMVAPEAIVLDGHSSQSLISDELICIADINNHEVGSTLTLEQFNSMGHVSVGFARVSLLSIEQWLTKTLETNRRIEVITSDFSTMVNAVLNTNRIAILPKHFADMYAHKNMLKVIKLPFEPPKLKESMMWHPTLDNDPMHRWLREQIIATAAKFE